MKTVCHLALLALLLSGGIAWAAQHGARRKPAMTPRTAAREAATVAAARALFEDSNSVHARSLLRDGAQQLNAVTSPEALFVEMEAASLQGDSEAAMEAAVRLCEASDASGINAEINDARVPIAAARILDSAANNRRTHVCHHIHA